MTTSTLTPMGVVHREHVEPREALDGTPLPDVKPYEKEIDLRLGRRGGWSEMVIRKQFLRRCERQTRDG
jgi:tRNA (Thr-GGU) A37 N-methylase